MSADSLAASRIPDRTFLAPPKCNVDAGIQTLALFFTYATYTFYISALPHGLAFSKNICIWKELRR